MPLSISNDLILITSAGGQQAAQLLPLLYAQTHHLGLVVYSKSSQTRLQHAYPDAEVLTADLAEPSEATRILAGVATVYHIGPTFHTFEVQIGYNMISAAVTLHEKDGTFKHFVYSSVIQTQLRKLLNHDAKRHVEEFLIESGLPYTILKPTHFLDPFPVASLLKSTEHDVTWELGWDPAVKSSFISLSDLSLAAHRVITEREPHFYAAYELCSTGSMSHVEQCDIAGRVMGKTIRPKLMEFSKACDEFVEWKFGKNVPQYSRDATERLMLYYNRHGLPGNPNVLEWIIGREPMTFQAWVEEKVKGIRSDKMVQNGD